MRPTELLEAAAHHYLPLSLGLLLLLCLVLPYRGKLTLRPLTLLPGPAEWPFIGALPWLFANHANILGALLRTTRELGFRTWTVKWLGEPRFLFITDPRNLEHVLLRNFANYPKGENFCSTLSDLLGRGIFVTDGMEWMRQRHLYSSLFTEDTFHTTATAALHRSGQALEAVLRASASASPPTPVDLFSLYNRFTLDTIGEVAFGVNLGTIANPEQPFIAAFDAAQQALDQRFFLPGWRWLKPLLPSEHRLAASIATMGAFCEQLIEARRADPTLQQRTDVLSRAMCKELPQGSGLYPFRDSTPLLKDLIMNFLIAGRDTTAQALSWATLCLASSAPELGMADRVAAEGEQLQGSSSSASPFAPSFEALESRLPYCSAVMQETLRLYPSVPKDLKTALAADVLPDGTPVVPGTSIVYLPYVMGRCPGLWGESAADFQPDRFLGCTGAAAPSPWKLPAFNGAGPRACLGRRLALAEANFVLALVFSRFTLQLSPAAQGEPGGCPHAESLTLPMARGLWVRVGVRGL